MTPAQLKQVQTIIQYEFKNEKLLQQAFMIHEEETDEEYSADDLRIIGIRVINYAPTYLVMEKYGEETAIGFHINMDKKEVKDILDNLYSRYMYSRIIQTLGLASFLEVTDYDLLDDMSRKLFEAIIGAVAVDCEFETKIFANVISYLLDLDYHLQHGFDNFEEHYVIKVYNWCAENGKTLPQYRFTSEIENGHKMHKCAVKFGASVIVAVSKSKTMAKFAAAKQVYDKLVDSGLIVERDHDGYVLNELKVTEEDAVSYLEGLVQNGEIEEPEYTTIQVDNDSYVTICKIDNVDRQVEQRGTTEEESKNKAALRMVKYILGYRID